MILGDWDIITKEVKGWSSIDKDNLVYIWHLHEGERAEYTSIRDIGSNGGVLTCRSCGKKAPPEIDGVVRLLEWDR